MVVSCKKYTVLRAMLGDVQKLEVTQCPEGSNLPCLGLISAAVRSLQISLPTPCLTRDLTPWLTLWCLQSGSTASALTCSLTRRCSCCPMFAQQSLAWPHQAPQGTVLLSSLFLVTSLPARTEEGSVCDACIRFHPFPKLMTLTQPHLFPSSRKWPFCVPHHLWGSDAHIVSGDPVCLPA